jgi:hypothetical protein
VVSGNVEMTDVKKELEEQWLIICSESNETYEMLIVTMMSSFVLKYHK